MILASLVTEAVLAALPRGSLFPRRRAAGGGRYSLSPVQVENVGLIQEFKEGYYALWRFPFPVL